MISAKNNDLIHVLPIGNYMHSSAISTTYACYRLVTMCVARWCSVWPFGWSEQRTANCITRWLCDRSV